MTDGYAFSVDSLVIASVVIVSVAAFVSERLRSALVLVPFLVRSRKQVHRLLTAGWVRAVRFLLLYVSAVVVAFIPTTLRHMNRSQYVSLGASGAVAAIMFSAILLRPTLRLSLMFLPLPIPGLLYALGYLAYSAYRSYRPRGNINHDAHFAGAVYGAALTFVFEPEAVQRAFARLLA